MTIVLHPEELLERARSELSPAELALLDAHLAGCVACRVLASARDDFEAERRGLTGFEPRVSLLSPALVEELERAGNARQTGVAPRRPRALLARLPLVAALVLAAVAAAAAGGEMDVTERRGPEPIRAVSAPMSAAVRARLQALVVAPARVTTPEQPVLPAEPSHVKRAQPRAVAPESAPKPELQFERAAEARARGDHAGAIALYRDLQQRFPSSDEARASRAIVARLLLDTGKSRAALDEYDRYLAGQPSALAEEALVGRALSFQRLGRTADEREAWRELLHAHPGSLHAPRARARLEATALPR